MGIPGLYFKSDGTAYFYDADFNQTDFTYNVGEWNIQWFM